MVFFGWGSKNTSIKSSRDKFRNSCDMYCTARVNIPAHFFTILVIGMWNRLPVHIVSSDTVGSFVRRKFTEWKFLVPDSDYCKLIHIVRCLLWAAFFALLSLHHSVHDYNNNI